MTGPKKLTDRARLLHNRKRVGSMEAPAFFLLKEAALDVQERLNEVNKTFKSVAIITGFPEFWQKKFPEAKIISDDPVLELEPGAYDLVLHVMCLHWADDPVGQLIQCRNALCPDGMFLGVFFGGQTLFQLRSAISEAEVSVSGGLSPRVLPMADVREWGALLQRAGFALPVGDVTTTNVSYENAMDLMRDLRAMGEGNALAARERIPAKKTLLKEFSRIYRENFGQDSGRIMARFDVIALTGWAPDASQPKPLRPGSATQRLSEALGTTETSLRD